MFNFFKRKKQKKEITLPSLLDLNNLPLQAGDIVESLRYDLGKCRVEQEGNGFVYVSLDSGEKVSWLKMIDAATENQKVKKIVEEEQ
ncbi:MAG: hypothetical protein AAFX87_00645 [Bacteroidota bacterium]